MNLDDFIDSEVQSFVRRIDAQKTFNSSAAPPPLKIQSTSVVVRGEEARKLMGLPKVDETNQVSPNSNAH